MSFKDDLVARFRWVEGHADVAALFVDGRLLAQAVAVLACPFEGRGVTKVAALEARGFVLGSGVALRLGAGFVPVRKAGLGSSRTEGRADDGPRLARTRAPAAGAASGARLR